MTIDDLAAAVRSTLSKSGTIREVKMFGGIGFMLDGNLVAAASKRGLLARVGGDNEGDALELPGTRIMEMRGRTMHGYIRLGPEALSDSAAKALLRLALAFVKTLPGKTRRSTPTRAKSKLARSKLAKSKRAKSRKKR